MLYEANPHDKVPSSCPETSLNALSMCVPMIWGWLRMSRITASGLLGVLSYTHTLTLLLLKEISKLVKNSFLYSKKANLNEVKQ